MFGFFVPYPVGAAQAFEFVTFIGFRRNPGVQGKPRANVRRLSDGGECLQGQHLAALPGPGSDAIGDGMPNQGVHRVVIWGVQRVNVVGVLVEVPVMVSLMWFANRTRRWFP